MYVYFYFCGVYCNFKILCDICLYSVHISCRLKSASLFWTGSVLFAPVCAFNEILFPVGVIHFQQVNGVASAHHVLVDFCCTVIEAGSVLPVNPHLGRTWCVETYLSLRFSLWFCVMVLVHCSSSRLHTSLTDFVVSCFCLFFSSIIVFVFP